MKQLKTICRECKTDNDPDAIVCQKCGLLINALELQNPECTIICPRCQKTNNSSRFFCYTCGKYFVDGVEVKTRWWSNKRRRGALRLSALKAKVIMPGGTEITLTGDPVFIERSDFDITLPHDLLMCISRQHILITYGKRKYYLKDYGFDGRGSTNHTKLNGIDIYNKGKKALKNGDKIELSGQPELTMTFRLLQD